MDKRINNLVSTYGVSRSDIIRHAIATGLEAWDRSGIKLVELEKK